VARRRGDHAVLSGIELARDSEQRRRQLSAVDRDARAVRRASVDRDRQRWNACCKAVREGTRLAARRREHAWLAVFHRDARDPERRVPRFEQLATFGLRARDGEPRGRHLHQLIGGLIRLERRGVVLLRHRRVALIHQRARRLAIGGRLRLRRRRD
jgi:hypothetical protein